MTSLQCVEAFSSVQLRGEQNHEGYGSQSGQYLHSWGGVISYGIRAGLVIPCGFRDTTSQSGPNEDVRNLSEGDCDAP